MQKFVEVHFVETLLVGMNFAVSVTLFATTCC